MAFPVRKLLKWFAGICAGLLLLLIAALGIVQYMLVNAPGYRTQLQQQIRDRTGVAVEIGELRARWRLFGPELAFDNVTLREADSKTALLTARGGSVGLDVWTSISSRRLTAGRFTLDAPQLAVQRTADGELQIVGTADRPGQDFDLEKLPLGHLKVTNASITYRDLQTDRAPLLLSAVQLDLLRRPGKMQWSGAAQLPAELGGAIAFNGNTRGQLNEPEKFGWSVSVNARGLDLAKWVGVVPAQWRVPRTGRGSLLLGGSFIGKQVQSLQAEAELAQVSLSVPAWSIPLPRADSLPDADSADDDSDASTTEASQASNASAVRSDVLVYQHIAGAVQLDRTREGWRVQAGKLLLAASDEQVKPVTMEVSWSGDASSALHASGRLRDLNIGTYWPLLAYLPETERNASLRALQLSGAINDLQFETAREAADQPLSFSVSGQFAGIGIAPVRRQPGVSGLNGQFSATQNGGKARIGSNDLHLEVPALFRDQLHATRLNGEFSWVHEAQGWRVQASRLDVITPDGKAGGSMDLFLPGTSETSPLLKLDFTAHDLNAPAAPRYMPAGRLNPRTLDWLDHAFKAGRVTEAKLHYDGPTRSFPFRHNEGIFLITAHIEGLTLDYQNGWTPAVKVATEVEFRNQGMSAQAQSGEVHGMVLEKVSAAIPDFRDAELSIDARGSADMNDALTYVQASPVAAGLGDVFNKLRGNGKAAFDVKLSFPFKRLKDFGLAVTARIADGTAGTEGVAAQVTELSGTLRVREHGLSTSDLQGKFLGAPVTVGIREAAALSGGRQETLVTAQGAAQAPELARLFNAPASINMAGSTQWRMNARFGGGVAGKLHQYYTLTSDLRGLQVGLPEPFGKNAAAAQDLRVDVEFTEMASALVRATIGETRALLKIAQQSDGGWKLDRGGLQLDGEAAAMPDHPGLRIEGHLETLVLDDWLRLKEGGSGGSDGSGRGVADYLRAANLRVGTFKLFGYTATDVRAVLQAVPEGWRVDVASPQATGGLTVPYDLSGSRALTGQFQHLSIGERELPQGGAAAEPLDPRKFPALQVHADEFEFGNRHLGSIDVQMDRVANGLKLSIFRAAGPAFNAEATGEWLANATGQTCSIDLMLTSSDVQQTLKALDYGNPLTAKHGELQAKLTWPGGIDERFLGRASGSMRLDVNSGQLLNIQPGAGRVLGLLSVAALPRRLSLDFSDLTDKGFGFDTIHGDFELRDGNAFTSNLLLSGPAAEIGIAGRTGLGVHDYDQTAVVTGNLGSSLPAAGLLAGGPVVGAALLLFSQVFKEPLKGITRGYYRITGSWEKPTVERVDSAEAKDAAANAEER